MFRQVTITLPATIHCQRSHNGDTTGPSKPPSQQLQHLEDPTSPPHPPPDLPVARVPGAPQPILGLVHLEYIGVLEQRDKRERDVGSK